MQTYAAGLHETGRPESGRTTVCDLVTAATMLSTASASWASRNFACSQCDGITEQYGIVIHRVHEHVEGNKMLSVSPFQLGLKLSRK